MNMSWVGILAGILFLWAVLVYSFMVWVIK